MNSVLEIFEYYWKQRGLIIYIFLKCRYSLRHVVIEGNLLIEIELWFSYIGFLVNLDKCIVNILFRTG